MKEKSKINNKGFSLIELIVAVLIIAIISSGAILSFNAIFSDEATAAARSVVDVIKQTRVYALGKENKESTASDKRTGVYAKFYYKDSLLNVDVCKNSSSGELTEVVLSNQTISSTPFKIGFYQVTSTGESEPFVMGDNESVRVYFKKSTGGVAVAEKINSAGDPVGSPVAGVNKIHLYRASNPANSKDLTLVNVTGRCYVDY